jgi:hypothetical protein
LRAKMRLPNPSALGCGEKFGTSEEEHDARRRRRNPAHGKRHSTKAAVLRERPTLTQLQQQTKPGQASNHEWKPTDEHARMEILQERKSGRDQSHEHKKKNLRFGTNTKQDAN